MHGQKNYCDSTIARSYPIALAAIWVISLLGCGPLEMGNSGQHVKFLGTTDKSAQTVTINADRVPLKQLLDEIAAETRISVILPKEMESESVTLSAQAEPLEHALRKLLDRKSFTFSYSTLAAGARDRRPLVAGVQISQEPNAILGTSTSPQAEQRLLDRTSTLRVFQARSALVGSDGKPASGQTLPPKQEPLEQNFSFDDLKQSIKEAKDPQTRLRLLGALETRQDEGLIGPTLADALGDPDEDIRQAALHLMKSSSEPVPLASLANMVSTEKNPETFIDVLTLISDSASEGTWTIEERDAVVAALTRGTLIPDPDVRDEAQSLLDELVASPQ